MGQTLSDDIGRIRKTLHADYEGMFREPAGVLKHPFIVPGSRSYSAVLWDWDSWLTNVALRQILAERGDPDALGRARPFERGCIRNYLSFTTGDGWMPICVVPNQAPEHPAQPFDQNMHKPCLAQHAAFLVRQDGEADWLREDEGFAAMQWFVNAYRNHHRHAGTGLYYWQTDYAIGVDNDPCTFYRPPRSSASIYLNCLMHRELEAMVFLCERLGLAEVAANYRQDTEDLRRAVQEHCWDERDGFFYSVDLNLVPIDHHQWLHQGMPRDWHGLIQRIGVWSGFLTLWAGLATPEQARRVVEGHYRDGRTFNAPYGVRTLSRLERMYNVRASGNPSSWLGPVWGVSNYLTFRGLVRCGFDADARELAEKTIRLFARDLERFGALHEYYEPDSGEPILNRGFQNWNYLVLNMIAWLEGTEPVTEF